MRGWARALRPGALLNVCVKLWWSLIQLVCVSKNFLPAGSYLCRKHCRPVQRCEMMLALYITCDMMVLCISHVI